MHLQRRLRFFIYGFLVTGLLSSCYKKDIQFGDNLADSHTRIITLDTVTPVMSTYIMDSFATSGNSFMLLGSYHDAFLGNTQSSSYFQVGLPYLSEDATTLLPKSAVYDSLVLAMKPSGYYYGDTTKPFSITVYELAAQPYYTNLGTSKIYNVSTLPLGAVLGSFNRAISPVRKDSVYIRLPDSKGQDFYTKIQNKATQFTSQTDMLNYFKGLCIQPSSDYAGAMYGFNLADSSVRLKLYYHLTTPYYQAKSIDFYLTNSSYQFNRIITDRSNTPLAPNSKVSREIMATAQYPYAFTQSGTGTLLKIKFPSLRDVLKIDDVVRLIDAKLIVKPVGGTWDLYSNKLPNNVFMLTTDNTNNPGSELLDTTGASIQYRSPNIDLLYGANTQYTFTITSYINALMNNGGTTEDGVFLLQSRPNDAKSIDRGVFGTYLNPNQNYRTKLVLSLLTID